MGHIIHCPAGYHAAMSREGGAEQDADIPIKLRLLTFAGMARSAVLPVQRQIPPKLFFLAFFGIDVAIDGFLADPNRGTVIDHPVANLFRRPGLVGSVVIR
jgi:hypothetical protein